MKKLLTLLFSFFLFSSHYVFADDISDFSIEGISIGDSLLDYMTEEEILKEIEENKEMYFFLKEPIKYKTAFLFENLKVYDSLAFHLKINGKNKYITDKSKNEKYEILSVFGNIFFNEDFDGCLKERDVVAEVFSEMFPDAQKLTEIKVSDADPTGEGKIDFIYFNLDSGARVTAYCNDYDETWRKKQNYSEGLTVNIQINEIVDWLSKTK
ncbi:hypothetical protein N9R34_01360 [Candidatus Thioglobus sp.]|nr:hypothetical protein [Candidatus Thioglobus sp.]MDB4099180.1 hypothetical protein [Candidatus Thioglobus sp.]